MTVRASLHGQWADGSDVIAGTVLRAGVWLWQGGLVELEISSGTVLMVEAPASLEIVDEMHARLNAGHLVVRMPKGRSGFVVETPGMEVLDLGTEFGVSVSPSGEEQVQVFDGKVRTQIGGRAESRELGAGETLSTSGDGTLEESRYDENRFIRRMPPDERRHEQLCGTPYNKSCLAEVRVAWSSKPVQADGVLDEWDRRVAFRSACLAPYADSYFLEGLMMYDATNLYLAAHVGDPDPLCNKAPDGFEFAGGSVIVRVSTDKRLGWPLRGTRYLEGVSAFSRKQISKEARNDRITNIIMWYDATAGKAQICLHYGIDVQKRLKNPRGWEGAFRKDPDGLGYTLEYVIPWRLLHCADDPPRPGETLPALWMVHWSDTEGRLARGLLVDVVNRQPDNKAEMPPQVFFQDGPSWGKAVYLPKSE
jgi:hypothetical protein